MEASASLADPAPSGRDPVRIFDLVPVPLSELHDWLEARGLVVCEHSVNWGGAHSGGGER